MTINEKKFELKTFGMPVWLCCAIAVIAIVSAATGALGTDLASCFVLMLAIGFVCNEIGERIPFWNSYIGGLIGAAILGVVAGLPFGINPVDVIIKYMLPIMGGGNGAGAVPLSQIYETITGNIIIALAVVIGAIIGSALVGYAVGVVLIIASVVFGAFLK